MRQVATDVHRSTPTTQLHSVDMESVARRLVEVACAKTGSRNGAVFLWDPKAKGLTVDFHMVDGVIVDAAGHGLGAAPAAGRPGQRHRADVLRAGRPVPLQRHRGGPELRPLLPRRGVGAGGAHPLAGASPSACSRSPRAHKQRLRALARHGAGGGGRRPRPSTCGAPSSPGPRRSRTAGPSSSRASRPRGSRSSGSIEQVSRHRRAGAGARRERHRQGPGVARDPLQQQAGARSRS